MNKARLTALLAPVCFGLGLLGTFVGSAPAVAATGIAFHFPAPPIAPAGSIGPGQSVTFNARVTLNGLPDPGATIYLLQLVRVSGDSTTVPPSQCGGVSQLPTNGSAIPCTADSKGNVPLTYHVPARPPASHASAQFVAQGSSSGSGQRAIDHYVYATIYRLSPSPIAPSGSLAPDASVPITLTADDASGNGVAGSMVYLSMKAAPGGGSAKVGTTNLTSTPSLFTVDSTGSLHITYTAPHSLPTSGQDQVFVQDSVTGSTEKNSTSYAFSSSAPVLSIGDSSVFEGDQNPGIPATFTVTISPVQPNPVTFQYVTLCGVGDKNCGEDFVQVFSPVTVTIPANTSSANFIVRQFSYIGGNGGETYIETWFSQILNPSVGVVGRSVGNGVLLPDSEGTSFALPLLYTGSAGVVPVNDVGGVPIYIVVALGAPEPGNVTFDYATLDGSAIGGVDYTPVSGTATIAAGHTSAVIPVTVLANSPPVSDKTFTLTISNATGGPTIFSATGTGTIMAG